MLFSITCYFKTYIYLFFLLLAVRGLLCCCSKQGLLSSCGAQAPRVQHGLQRENLVVGGAWG